MARVSRPNASPQDPQSLRPLDPILPRHTALLAIFVMLIAILFFNIASYSLGAMASRLGKMPILNADSQTRQSDELDLGGQDWQIVFLTAPATTKLCFATNVFIGAASCFALMYAFFWWMTNASLISGSVRNCALLYGVGAGTGGVLFIHLVLVPRWSEGEGFLMAVNSILGPLWQDWLSVLWSEENLI